MKVINSKQSFKSVRQTQVDRLPVLADRLGKKRADVNFDLPQYELVDVANLAAEHGEVLVTCLNDALANLAKAQFADNQTDWSFSPSLESLSLAALKVSFEAVTRGRVLTLESAGKLAVWLQANVAAIVTGIKVLDATYSATQASAIAGIVAKYTAYESKGPEFNAKVALRLEQVSEAIMNNDALAESFTEVPELANVFDALVRKFSKVDADDEITADAL